MLAQHRAMETGVKNDLEKHALERDFNMEESNGADKQVCMIFTMKYYLKYYYCHYMFAVIDSAISERCLFYRFKQIL